MIFIFAGATYRDYKISLAEFGRLKFMLYYNFFPIVNKSATKVQEYVLDGLAVEPPKGNDMNYNLTPVITRVIERLDGRAKTYIPNENYLYCDTKISRNFPAINWLEKIVGLDMRDLRRNIYADIRDLAYFQAVGNAMQKGFIDMYSLSEKLSKVKSNKEIVELLANNMAAKKGMKSSRILEFYDTIKTISLIVTMNAKIVESTFKTKMYFGQFQKHQLEVFEQRGMVDSEKFDDTLQTLNKYSELIGNENFLQNNRWKELTEKLKEYGIILGDVPK